MAVQQESISAILYCTILLFVRMMEDGITGKDTYYMPPCRLVG